MKLLVLDNYESFSLVPYLKKAMPSCELLKMGNLYTEQMWQIFRNVAPDVVFVDFCDKNAAVLTHRVGELPKKPKIVARLHGFEASDWHLAQVDWSQVSDLIVVSPKFLEILSTKLAGAGVRIHQVSNGIDLDKYQLQDKGSMEPDAIAYVGYLNKKKGPTLLRTVMASMMDRRFFVGGVFQDEHVHRYFLDLEMENVVYAGWIQTDEFLKGKRYILSTSVTESFGMSIAEGMAMGLTPLVHWWPGADQLWPRWCLWTTFDELRAIQPVEPAICRKWIEDRYSMGSCIESVVRLLEG